MIRLGLGDGTTRVKHRTNPLCSDEGEPSTEILRRVNLSLLASWCVVGNLYKENQAAFS
jgi:hypothetical protein